METDYKSLTTNNEQRESFRSHIVNAVVGTLTPAQANNDATEDDAVPELQEIDLDIEEDINVGIGGGDNDKFIDIRTDAEKKADEEEDEVDPRDALVQTLVETKLVAIWHISHLKKLKPQLLIRMSYYPIPVIKNFL